uniref:Uncharacterized protein n=1 Tax=Arundo donax TaxID=35708 RepID=A0A0A9C4B0_ARUDO
MAEVGYLRQIVIKICLNISSLTNVVRGVQTS